MPIYHNGNKVASIYHLGHKVARAYHMGNLVYDSSGGDTEPPIWDIAHYLNAVDYANAKAAPTTSQTLSSTPITNAGGSLAYIKYPTVTMQNQILLFDVTQNVNKVLLYNPSLDTCQLLSIDSSSGALQRASKPIVDNAGNVVFFTQFPYWRKISVNTSTLAVTDEQVFNNASLTITELLQSKWYDSPYGLTTILVRTAMNNRIDVVRLVENNLEVVATNTIATTADPKHVQLLPNGILTLKQNAYETMGASAYNIIEYRYPILSNNTVFSRNFVRIPARAESGTIGPLLFDNSGNTTYDCLSLSTPAIIKTPFSTNNATTITAQSSVSTLYGAIRTASNHWLCQNMLTQPRFVTMSNIAFDGAPLPTLSPNRTTYLSDYTCVLQNGRIVMFDENKITATPAYFYAVSAKTACSPFFGK